MSPEDRPIGYWLKLLDGLIEASLDQALAGEGATRRQWQALNMIHTAEQGAATAAEIGEALAPFLDDDQGAAHRVLGELIRKGWVRKRPDEVTSRARARSVTSSRRAPTGTCRESSRLRPAASMLTPGFGDTS